jgi:type VI secretion system secreted protein Hcp
MAVDYFLKLDGISGEAPDQTNHKDEIQIMSFSWGGSQVSSVSGTGGSGAGKVDLSDISIMTNFDKATPTLFKSLCNGTHIKTGKLTAVKSGAKGKPYLTVDFTELFVSSLQLSASSEIPTVSLSFSYKTISIDYKVQDADGNLKSTGPVSYDLSQPHKEDT